MIRKQQFLSSTTTSTSRLLSFLLLFTIFVFNKYDVVHSFTTMHPQVSKFQLKQQSIILQANSMHYVQKQRPTVTSLRIQTMIMMTMDDDDNNEREVSLLNDINHQKELNDELDRILASKSSSSNSNILPAPSSASSSSSSPSRLRQAMTFLQEHADTIQLNKSNWDQIFTTIEDLTAELAIDMGNNNDPNNNNNNAAAATVEFPIQDAIRQDMTDMYQLLATLPLKTSSSSSSSSSTSESTTPGTPLPTNVLLEPPLR